MPETNHACRVFIVAAVLHFAMCVIFNVISHAKYVFYFRINNFQSMRKVPNMVVLCTALSSCFPGMLLRNCLNEFQIVSVASINNGINFAFALQVCWISVVRFLYFRTFSGFFS